MIRQFISHSASYTAANLLSRGTILVWLIVLPRFLDTADYGVLGLILTIAAIVNVSVPLEVSQGLARYYATAPAHEQKAWASTAWTFNLATLLLGAMVAFALAPWLTQLVFGNERYVAALRLSLAYFVLGTSFLFLQSQCRWAFRTRDYATATIVFAVVTLSLSVALAATLRDSLWGVLIGLVAGAAAGVAVALLRLGNSLSLAVDRRKLRRMLRFSMPLVPASIALMISTYGSRFILNDVLTLSDVGLFTWASQLANIPATLMLGVQAAVTPLVMKHHAEPETPHRLARIFETVATAGLIVATGLALFTPEFIDVLGYSSYAAAAPLVALLGPAYLLLQLYVFFPGFAVAEKTSLQLLTSLAAAGATLVLNYALIGRLGLVGAGIASLACSLVFLGLWVVLSGRHYRVPVSWGRLALFGTVAVAVGLGGGLVGGDLVVAIIVKLILAASVAAAAVFLGFIDPGRVVSTILKRGNVPAAALQTGDKP